jgi:hypothetical protein
MDDIAAIRHLVATLAYRAAKVLRDAPPSFANTPVAPAARQPVQIVGHLGDLIAWGVSLCDGQSVWRPEGTADWQTEVRRFFSQLDTLDRRLTSGPVTDEDQKKLISGPLADALTHVGQLAMLRGMAGAPVKPESYAGAPIVAGRVGIDQGPPRREFDGDASARR